MTDRVHSITVVLDKNYRTDDVVCILDAIQQLRGILSAKANVADLESHIAEQRALEKLRDQMHDILYPKN